MSWKNRKCSDLSPETLHCLLNADEVIELANPSEYGYGPVGPWKFDRLIGSGVHKEFIGATKHDLFGLRSWLSESEDLVMGHFCYDLKNLLERVDSKRPARIPFPLFRFFIPSHVAIQHQGEWVLHSHEVLTKKHDIVSETRSLGSFSASRSKEEYIETVQKVLMDIQNGEIYETNFCLEHWAEDASIEPRELFETLVNNSRSPFSCRLSHRGRHLICASPERFMMKVGSRVCSQPIKGTNRRMAENDAALDVLREDFKERAENIMITDLVRNDLSRSAAPGTVKVEELCGTYPFAHVNQMISTVSCELRPDLHPLDVLLSSFPMGSMTGAPKVRAMQLMEEYEGFSRGLFSGSVGYFTPELDFDFNVVIRSVLYDEEQGILSFPTGSAITIKSDPEKEWEECQLKAESIRSILLQHVGED